MARPKKPTKIKELQGTIRKCREDENEMQVAQVVEMPSAPSFLNEQGAKEWDLVTNELANIKMLHLTDLAVLAAYCNEMGTYHALAQEMGGNYTERTYDKDGKLRASKIAPKYKVMQAALQNALKIATQFGFTPSSRASLSMPEQDKEKTDDFNFFE
jgi:P27 family predicted phage terminase small subunit